ncbi:MAG: glycoside hydrolase family 3 N-terminal domain-containing protein [Chloroflexota bacterium]
MAPAPATSAPAPTALVATTRQPPTSLPTPPPAPAERPTAAPSTAPPPRSSQAQAQGEDPQVERTFATLATDADRVGQLLLLGWPGSSVDAVGQTLAELKPGGIMYLDNTRSSTQARSINEAIARISRDRGLIPPLVAIDHEGGNVQRLADLNNLGSNAQFASRGATARDACERGQRHAQQLKPLGFSMNLAPVLDVNNNPNNPVIGPRSYGADPELVATLGAAYARGLQSGGIAAVGKHFPGHGNTGVDSHLQLPVLPQSIEELSRVELVPFARAIGAPTNIAGIMSAHIVFPAVDPSRAPGTLSAPIMRGLLRDKMGFRGVVLSDDLAGMKAITDNFRPGEAAVRAVRAGVDLLIIAGDLPRQRESRDALVAALASGELDRARVDEAVRNVLRTKLRFGLLGSSSGAEVGCQ